MVCKHLYQSYKTKVQKVAEEIYLVAVFTFLYTLFYLVITYKFKLA